MLKLSRHLLNYLGNDEFEIIYNISSGKKFYFNEFNLNLPNDYEKNFQQLDKIFKEILKRKLFSNSIDKILKEIDKIALNEQFEFLNLQ